MGFTRRKFGAGTAALLCGGLLARPTRAMAAMPIVETTYGRIRGVVEVGGSYEFRGIPYGASTAGANRFMPPKPPMPWSGVRDAYAFGPQAPQQLGRFVPTEQQSPVALQFAQFFGTHDVPNVQSEDCLYLNVHTPGLDGNRRPVMVWLHGGGFSGGGASGSRNDGTNLALRRDVVVVSFNHRLGALGYVHLGQFDADFAHSGNVGQLDQIAALRWVRDNIERFGGDPGRVTIFGESGGGGKVNTLMAMPGARGLFHRVINQSGSANYVPRADESAELAERLLAKLGLSKNELGKLQQTPAEQIIEAATQLEMESRGLGRRGFVPTANTVDLPDQPAVAIAKGSARVPLVTGSTSHEAALQLTRGGTELTQLTDAALERQIGETFGAKAGELLEGYRRNHPDYGAGELLVRIMSDRTRMGSIALAESHIKGGGAPTYAYMFAWESPVLPELRSAHGIDGTFYFDNTETVDIARGNPVARELARKASNAWTNFARFGDPNAPQLPYWPEYTLERRETMILSGSPEVVSDPMSADRELRRKLDV
jgi:para-nitrobenzyl esterase